MKTLLLTGNDLTLENIKDFLDNKTILSISKEKIKELDNLHNTLKDKINSGLNLYGINTGFGELQNIKIDKHSIELLQKNLIKSHTAGIGEPLSYNQTRLAMLLRANTLIKGYSGVRSIVPLTIINLLNKDIIPIIPSIGSLGASGDLAPLSHIALLVIGEDLNMPVFYKGEKTIAKIALKETGIKPIKLCFKEGLALNNGCQVSTAVSIINYMKAREIISLSNIALVMTISALSGFKDFLNQKIHKARGQKGQLRIARGLARKLKNNALLKGRKNEVQDAYSIRCYPQVGGAVLDTLDFIYSVLSKEINAATDNPLIFKTSDNFNILSGGNFHCEPIGLVMDYLSIAMTEIASISERRIYRLLDKKLNKILPAFLANNPGLESGYMLIQYTAAALLNRNRTLATPATIDNIVTSGGQEDHVSMSMNAALKAQEILKNTETILAIELLSAYRALKLNGLNDASINHIISFMDKIVGFKKEDHILSNDINKLIKNLKYLYERII